MPRSVLAVQEVAKNKSAQATGPAADQANGNMFDNDGKTRLVVKNGDASPRTATVVSVACSHGRTLDDALVLAAGEVGVMGPYDPELVNQSADPGKAYVNWSAGTTAAVKCTPVRSV